MVRRIRHRTLRGTANRFDGRLDYELPAPWDVNNITDYTTNADLLATLGDSATSIPLKILNQGSPGQGRNDDDDGNPYDVLFWEIDSTEILGFEQEVYTFREPAVGTGSVTENIPLSPTGPFKSAVIILEDYESVPVRQGVATGRPIAETSGDDFIVYSSSGNDILFGLEGADNLFSGGGADLVNGGSGTDRIVGNSGDDQLYGEAEEDDLHGLDGKDQLYGGSGNDELFGGNEDDLIYAGSGDDVLNGDSGIDTLIGGSGNDIYEISSDALDIITELPGEGIDTVETGLNYTLPNNIERLVLTGANALIGIGNGQDNVIEEKQPFTSGILPIVNNIISAGDGNDSVDAGDGNDAIDGGAGNDILFGGRKTDILTGGAGADQFLFKSYSGLYFATNDSDGLDVITDFNLAQGDRLVIAQGDFLSQNDPIGLLPVGSLDATRFHQGSSALLISHRFIYNAATGALFYDRDGSANVYAQAQIATLPTGLVLNSSAIEVIGGFSIPPVTPGAIPPVAGVVFTGTPNTDRLFGNEGSDTLNLLAGDDIGSGQEGNDTLNGGDGKDFLEGGSGDDQILGEAGSDRLLGEAGTDNLNGGSENDTLYGGIGNDVLVGGAGEDRFNFYNPAIDGTDQIADFNVAQDKIGIYVGNSIDSVYLDAGLTPNAVITGEQFRIGANAGDSNDRLIYNSATGALLFDVDGNGTAAQVQIATLSVGLALTNSNLFAFDDSNSTAPESGTATNDSLEGGSSNDTLNGLAGNDILNGGEGSDRLVGGAGNDVLNGGAAKDILLGSTGNDRLRGGGGNDRLEGGNGKDRLFGGLGNDKLFGGKGRDIFALEKGAGRDRIEDFQNGLDRLGLSPGLRFRKLAIQQKGQNTLIRFGKDPLALLIDVQADQITKTDFVPVQLV